MIYLFIFKAYFSVVWTAIFTVALLVWTNIRHATMRSCWLFCFLSHRLCLNGKLVSQTTEAGEWIYCIDSMRLLIPWHRREELQRWQKKKKKSPADFCLLCRQVVSSGSDLSELHPGRRRQPPSWKGRGLWAHLRVLPAQPHLLNSWALRGRMRLSYRVSVCKETLHGVVERLQAQSISRSRFLFRTIKQVLFFFLIVIKLWIFVYRQ